MANSYRINFTDLLSDNDFQVQPYTTDGSVFPTTSALASSSLFTSTSLVLYGKGSPNYGELIQENLVHLLENFAGATEPLNPVNGQLWFRWTNFWRDISSSTWYEWDSNTSSWSSFSPNTVSSDPTNPSHGDLWFRTDTSQLKQWDGRTGINKAVVRFFKEQNGTPPTGQRPVDLMVYDGTQWIYSNTINTGTQQPSSGQVGELFYNQSIPQLEVYDGTSWVSVADRYALLDANGSTQTFIDPLVFDSATTFNSNLNITSGTFTVGSSANAIINGVIDLNNDVTFSSGITISVGNGTNIDLNNNSTVINVPTPTVGHHVASKAYVDSAVSGGVGGIDLGDLNDVTVPSPSDNHLLAFDSSSNEWINQTATQAGVFPLSGGTITGSTTFDDTVTFNNTITANLTLDVNGLLTAGGGLDVSGASIDNVATPSTANQAANKQYVDNQSGDFVDLGTYTGSSGSGVVELYLSSDHVTPITSFSGFITTASELSFSSSGSISSSNVQTAIEEVDDQNVSTSGDNITGNITFLGGASLVLDHDPVSGDEAATKNYVDSLVTASQGSTGFNQIDRSMYTVEQTGSPTDGTGPFTTPEYIVGADQLFVYVNGIKYYGSIYGYSEAILNPKQTSINFTQLGTFSYTINQVDTGTNTIYVDGHNASDFSVNDRFMFHNNTGVPTSTEYSVQTVTNTTIGSPAVNVTEIVTNESIDSSTTDDGYISKIFEFTVDVDGVVGAETVDVDSDNAGTYSDLINEINNDLSSSHALMIYGDIRIVSNSAPPNTSSIVINDDSTSTRALFNNLSDWTGTFEQIESAEEGYLEIGQHGTLSTQIEFTSAPSDNQRIEYLVFKTF